jgi:hypothetical protein
MRTYQHTFIVLDIYCTPDRKATLLSVQGVGVDFLD